MGSSKAEKFDKFADMAAHISDIVHLNQDLVKKDPHNCVFCLTNEELDDNRGRLGVTVTGSGLAIANAFAGFVDKQSNARVVPAIEAGIKAGKKGSDGDDGDDGLEGLLTSIGKSGDGGKDFIESLHKVASAVKDKLSKKDENKS